MGLLDLPQFYLDRLMPEPNSGCWLWIGRMGSGYGQRKVEGRIKGVHRLIWELLRSPIPEGFEIDHQCRTPLCCNPAHLEVVTHAVNMSRRVRVKPLLTHCKRGHLLEADNLYVAPDGERVCRICYRLRKNAFEKRKREKR